jgi:hypothetical protein
MKNKHASSKAKKREVRKELELAKTQLATLKQKSHSDAEVLGQKLFLEESLKLDLESKLKSALDVKRSSNQEAYLINEARIELRDGLIKAVDRVACLEIENKRIKKELYARKVENSVVKTELFQRDVGDMMYNRDKPLIR